MELEIKGTAYKTAPLNAIKQFHIVRRLGPLFSQLATPGVLSTLKRLQDSANDKADDKSPDVLEVMAKLDLSELFGPFSAAFGELSDASSEYIIMECLRVTSRQVAAGGPWAKLVVNNQLMYDDVTMAVMLRLVWAVVQENLAGFLSELQLLFPDMAAR
jgi:hypothetical protein